MTAAVVLAGCQQAYDPTRIESLRIVALNFDPCQQVIGQVSWVTATVADPAGVASTAAMWTCPDEAPDEPCWVRIATLGNGAATAGMTSSGPGDLWVVVCALGVCDPALLSEDERRDPTGWLASLPRDGVAAARGTFHLVPFEEREAPPVCTNPMLESAPLVRGPVAPGEVVPLEFVVSGAGVAYTYATGGSFPRVDHDLGEGGTLAVEWTAPAVPGDYDVYVVFVHTAAIPPFGVRPTQGTAVWDARLEVR